MMMNTTNASIANPFSSLQNASITNMRRPRSELDECYHGGNEPERKRRRTIVDAFAQACNISEKRQQEIMTMPTDEDSSSVHTSDSDDEEILTAKDLADREVMRRMVFGEETKNPADRRFQQLLRDTFKQGQKPDTMQCDMDIETSYSRPSPNMSGVQSMRPRSNSLDDLQTGTSMDVEPL